MLQPSADRAGPEAMETSTRDTESSSTSRPVPTGGSALRVAIAAPAHLNPYPVLFQQAVQQAVQQADPALVCELWRSGLSWRRLLGRKRPDILHLHWLELLYRHYAPRRIRTPLWFSTLLAIGVARLLGTRIVYTVHNVWQHEEEGRRLYRLAHRWALRLSSAVHVHNEAARDELLRLPAGGGCHPPWELWHLVPQRVHAAGRPPAAGASP